MMARARRTLAALTLAAGSIAPAVGAAPSAGAADQALPGSARPAAGDFRWTGALSQGGLIVGTVPAGTVTLALDGALIPVADGRFIAGFDHDAGPQALLVATLADGRLVTRMLAIAPRAWSISRLTTLPRYPVPAPEFSRIRPAELAAIAAARALETGAQGWRQRFAWPTTGRISTLFGSQRVYRNGEAGAYHAGIDIARSTGTIVRAPADGMVILAADHPFTLEGNLLMIDHGMGLDSAFLHLSRIDVRVGDHVSQGQPIGAVGMTGRATGPHLHWGLHWRGAKLDPLLVTGPMPMG